MSSRVLPFPFSRAGYCYFDDNSVEFSDLGIKPLGCWHYSTKQQNCHAKTAHLGVNVLKWLFQTFKTHAKSRFIADNKHQPSTVSLGCWIQKPIGWRSVCLSQTQQTLQPVGLRGRGFGFFFGFWWGQGTLLFARKHIEELRLLADELGLACL